MRLIRIYLLACKYWIQGDEWDDALYFARRITDPFYRKGGQK